MKTILVIEDDIFFQKFYANKLSENGYAVEAAVNGIEGLDKLKKGNIDLVLLDLVMPQKDGFEVLEEKTANKKLTKIPVIVFTALTQEKDAQEAKKLGASDFISKTFGNFPDLLAKIKALIGEANK